LYAKAEYYPWKHFWYKRRFNLLHFEEIYQLRKALTIHPEDWRTELIDEYYLVPDLSSNIEYYNITDLINDHEKPKDKHSKYLTKDDAKELPHTELAGVDLSNTEDILRFVHKHGLLGIGDILVSQIELDMPNTEVTIKQHGVETSYNKDLFYINEIGEESLTLNLYQYGDTASFASKSFIRDVFFPLQHDLDNVILPNIQAVLSIANNQSLIKLFSEAKIDISITNPFTFNIVNYYSEPLCLFKEHVEEYQSLYTKLYELQNHDITPRDAFGIELTFKEHLKNVHPYFVYNYDRKSWDKGWQVGTLIEACYLLLYLDIAAGLNARYCKHCHTPFIATKENHYYCSTQCQRNEKQKRYRERKKSSQL